MMVAQNEKQNLFVIIFVILLKIDSQDYLKQGLMVRNLGQLYVYAVRED